MVGGSEGILLPVLGIAVLAILVLFAILVTAVAAKLVIVSISTRMIR